MIRRDRDQPPVAGGGRDEYDDERHEELEQLDDE